MPNYAALVSRIEVAQAHNQRTYDAIRGEGIADSDIAGKVDDAFNKLEEAKANLRQRYQGIRNPSRLATASPEQIADKNVDSVKEALDKAATENDWDLVDRIAEVESEGKNRDGVKNHVEWLRNKETSS